MNTQYFIPFMFILGFFLLYIGLKIIIGKKPIIMNSKWLLVMLIILYIPLLIIPIIIDINEPTVHPNQTVSRFNNPSILKNHRAITT